MGNLSGEYYLSFSIPEPVEGSWSLAVRFANTNYFSSGEHPVGKIGVNHIIDDGSINPNSFDSLD